MIVAQQKELVDQAKELLITRAHITEGQAHRFIQKRAMDLRISKVECATQIIARYNQLLERKKSERAKAFAEG